MKYPNGNKTTPVGKLKTGVLYFWKNKYCIRKHIIPPNPRTLKQQLNRYAMAMVVKVAQSIYDPLIKVGWQGLYQNLPAWHNFVKFNKLRAKRAEDFDKIYLTQGYLQQAEDPISAVYRQSDGYFAISWNTLAQGNGSPDDYMVMILLNLNIYYPTKKHFEIKGYQFYFAQRKDGLYINKIDAGIDSPRLFLYLGVVQFPVQEKLLFADSKFKIFTFIP